MRTLAFTILLCCTFTGAADASDDVRAYGEYLSGECTGCHRKDGSEKGIPSIVGWDVASFVAVMGSYKSGDRDNAAMVSVAKSLDDEQVFALASYFASLKAADEKPSQSGQSKKPPS